MSDEKTAIHPPTPWNRLCRTPSAGFEEALKEAIEQSLEDFKLAMYLGARERAVCDWLRYNNLGRLGRWWWRMKRRLGR